jgi:hypothetical protein
VGLGCPILHLKFHGTKVGLKRDIHACTILCHSECPRIKKKIKPKLGSLDQSEALQFLIVNVILK